MLQGGYQKVILGVILVFLLAIFELNIMYNRDEPYLLHEEVSVQYLNPLAGKINYTNTDKKHPNLPSAANDKKHQPKELKQEVIMEQSEKVQQSVKQEPVEKIKQSQKTQLPGNINQGDKKQPPLPPVTSNPLQQLVNLIGTKPGMYNSYLKTLSTSQLKSVIDQLGLCNLTLQKSQMQFFSCGGKSLLKQLKGKQLNSSVHMPSSFHHCKNMSFKSSGPSVALASYPGSGNSWVRQLLESATGIYTGAIYCDSAYLKAGMIGESVATSNVLAVKTHVPLFTGKNVLGKLHHDKAIYIVRNPFDAFLADHNRALATRAPRVYGNAHTAEVSYKYGMYVAVAIVTEFMYVHVNQVEAGSTTLTQ